MFFFFFCSGQHEKTRKIFHLPRNFQIFEQVREENRIIFPDHRPDFPPVFHIVSTRSMVEIRITIARGREAADEKFGIEVSLATCFRGLVGEGKLRFVRHDSISTEAR